MPTKQVSDAILSMFRDSNNVYGAFDLLELLKREGIGEADFKEALAYLISEHQVELTPERRLQAVRAPMYAHA